MSSSFVWCIVAATMFGGNMFLSNDHDGGNIFMIIIVVLKHAPVASMVTAMRMRMMRRGGLW